MRPTSRAYVPPSRDDEILLGLYRRISDADDELGVDRQLAELMDPERGLLATNHLLRGRRVTIVKIYTDNNISAHDITKVRPDFQQMQLDVANGIINSVGAWAADRLFRQPHEFEAFCNTMEICGGLLIVTLDNDNVDIQTSEGLLSFRLKINVADEEVRKGKRRIRSKNLQLRTSANVKYQGGVRRFGFNADMTELIEVEAREIRYCAEQMLAGKPVYTLAGELNARGVRTVKDKIWRQTNLQRVVCAFRNAALFIDIDGVAKPAQWPAILDRDVFTRLQVMINDPTRNVAGGNPKATEALSGMLLCGACLKSNLRIQRTSSGINWLCQSDGGCGKLGRRDVHLSPVIIPEVLAAYRDPTFVSALISSAQEIPEENLLSKLRTAEALLKEVKDAFWTPPTPEERMNRDDFLRYSKIHEGTILELRDRMRVATKKQTVNLDLILGGHLDDQWEALPLHEKQALLRFAVRKVVVKPVGKGRRNLPPSEHYEIQWRDAM